MSYWQGVLATRARWAHCTRAVATSAAAALALGLPATNAVAASGPAGSAGTGSALGTLTSTEGVEVPVHGVVRYRAADGLAEPGNVTAAVHGVQRVDGATVLYWSAGTRDEREIGSQALGRRSSQPVRSWVPVQ